MCGLYQFANANVNLPKIFADHMVLQQNQKIIIWGWASPNEKVTVTLNRQKANVKADAHGKWLLELSPQIAGGPYKLSINGINKIIFNDVMIGEVWLCSGQSNMAFELTHARGGKAEISHSSNSFIRQFGVNGKASASRDEDLTEGKWEVSSPETSPNFSAVAYYYAKKISSELGVTVGIVNSSWGGTFIADWISSESLHKLADYNSYHDLTPKELEDWYSQTEKKYDDLFKTLGIADRNKIVEDSLNWLKPDIDDSKWVPVQLPSKFDYNLLPRFDGVVWFRRNIEVPEGIAKSGFTIHLGRIDDEDITYVNGVKIGETKGDRIERDYFVKPEILKPGKNSIVIRVTDLWERGGFLNGDDEFKISGDNKEIKIAGEWKMNIGKMILLWLRSPNAHPNLLYNGMIYPLHNYGFRGVVWYQGENNTMYASQYQQDLKTLIVDWRNTFKNPNLPFYIVQLPNKDSFNNNSQNGGSDWAELRESQAKALELPNTYLTVNIDLGDSTNVHPINKFDVANRLALLSLKNTYRAHLGEVASPFVQNIVFDGFKTIITFKNTGKGLIVRERYGYIKGFEVAGEDKKFYWAKAIIVGDKVVVTSQKVQQPKAVRYAWASNPSDANLYNVEGFPAAPFRSDNWEVGTQNEKYLNWIK